MPNEAEIYADYMTGARMRIDEIGRILAVADMPEFARNELIFLQLRKSLELIAFASLAANKDAYAAVFPTFAEDWKAKRILEKIEKINPYFYPAHRKANAGDSTRHAPRCLLPTMFRRGSPTRYLLSTQSLA